MNQSIYGADRATHLKILFVALVMASVGVLGFVDRLIETDRQRTQYRTQGRPVNRCNQFQRGRSPLRNFSASYNAEGLWGRSGHQSAHELPLVERFFHVVRREISPATSAAVCLRRFSVCTVLLAPFSPRKNM